MPATIEGVWRGLFAAAWCGAIACASPPNGSSLQLSSCRLDPAGVEARCAAIRVFEDRAAGAGRELTLRVAVLPALGGNTQPDPLFMLVGGPGQAATEAAPQILERLHEVRQSRDVVLVDQRGTGASHPLDCKEDENEPLSRRFAPTLDLAETRACLSALDADTTRYVTPLAMDDLDEVRQKLGYERINLWGGSYGTRAALVYYRQHPERVRSLILDGAAPPAIKLQLLLPRQAERALQLALGDCEKDPECRRAFPDVRAALALLFEELSGSARALTLLHPRTHAPEELRIDRPGLSMAVLQALYVPDLTRLLPLAVDRAKSGDYGPWVAMASAFSERLGLSSGMFLSVVCAEDIRRISPAEARELTAGTFLGAEWLERLRAQCSEWPNALLPDSYYAPISGDVPALILSGDLDPVTPPEWGELTARELSSSRHVVVPGAAHGVSVVGCVPRLIREFLETRDASGLDLGCLAHSTRPAFFTSLAGPAP
jgi:pimeloyl-ACP methyl ester carboxylesterase